MFKDTRVLTSVLLILVILQSTGCTVSIQIGGKKNSVEQNRQAPTAQSEAATSQPPAQVGEQSVVAEQDKKQDEEQQIADQQKLADEQKLASERAEEERRQAAELQRAEELRIETENYNAEQQRRAQEQYALEQTRRAEEQRLAEVQRQRQAEEQRLTEIQRQADSAVTSNQPRQVIVVYPSRQLVPIRRVPHLVPTRRVPLQPSFTSNNASGNLKNCEKKGHSTRKKVLIGTAIAGGTALGIWLGKRH